MAYELHRTLYHCTNIPTPELPALPDALEEGHEVSRDLGLLVLEADGPLAVLRLDKCFDPVLCVADADRDRFGKFGQRAQARVPSAEKHREPCALA